MSDDEDFDVKAMRQKRFKQKQISKKKAHSHQRGERIARKAHRPKIDWDNWDDADEDDVLTSYR